MRHVFKATKLGWKEEKDAIWFDSKHFTKEQAEAELKPYKGKTKDGYPYTGFEYGGQKYHDYTYLGEFKNNEMPKNDADLSKKRRKK